MYDQESRFNLFQSHYEKDIVLYGKESIYEPLDIALEEIIEHLKKNKSPASIALAFGVRTGKDYNGKNILIFERISFSMEHTKLFDYILSDPEDLLGGIFFINCCFNGQYRNIQAIRPNICFRSCIFRRDLVITDTLNKMCIFTDCEFEKQLSFRDTVINDSLYIEKSRFGDESSLILEGTKFAGEDKKYVITETVFGGPVYAKGLISRGKLELKKITFYKQFDFRDVSIAEKSMFEDFAYGHTSRKEIISSKKSLNKALQENGYTHQVSKLDLLEDCDNRGKFDISTYQAACKSGQLNSNFATYYIEKSSSYLAKMRVRDRKRIARDSIPYIGTGKNITYPIDALDAYKSSDWAKLRELREKYKYKPNKED